MKSIVSQIFPVNTSLSDNAQSERIRIDDSITCSMHLKYTGDGTGEFTVRVSSFDDPDKAIALDWDTIDDEFRSQPSGVAGSSYIEFNTGARWAIVDYNHTADDIVITESKALLKDHD